MNTPNSTATGLPDVEAMNPSVNILIVDDEPKNLAVLESVLDDPGYRLIRATSGEEALLAMMNNEFALLILDVRMPGMSGFEVAQLVKERKKTARIPIIFLTAYFNEDQHVLEGYGSGAVDYLHKPVNVSVLRSKVAVFAELYRKGRAVEAANRLLLGEVAERRNAEQRLSDLNATLDRRVQARTKELEASEARLIEAHHRKDEFLATLAHELRNPLAPVRNAVELLKRHKLDGERFDWATGLIDRQVGVLSRLIDDLMDVSRINQGRIELRRESVAVTEVLGDAVEAIRAQAEESRHELAVLLPDSNITVHGDRLRLAQAFLNLLSNAVKYTDPGGRIEVGVLLEKENVVVTIRDTGIGIAPEHLDNVFEMFSQVESALSRSRGGLGIGLSLTQRLIQMHGGTVKAFSEGLGRGSRFHVTLPLAIAVPVPMGTRPPMPVAPPTDEGLRILVADDNRDGAETLAALMEALGHTVRTAHDGEEAVAAVAEFAPQLVLLDIGMPKLNGYDACRRIRAGSAGATDSGPMIAAVTGWGQPQDVQRSHEAGFDHHLVKPVSLDLLLPIFDAARNRRGGAQQAAGA